MAGAPAAAARKPLPERLREKLREQNEARRQVYNPYTQLEAPPDEYDAERRMMDEILRGAGRAPPAAPVVQDTSGDLVGQMASRLRKLEESVLKLRAEASKRDLEVRRLRHENAELRKLVGDDSTVTSFDECEGLRKEVASMKAFLADYGLVWVGGPAPAPSFDSDKLLQKLNDLNEKVADKKIVQNGSRAKFEHSKVLRVTVYADGILVGAGPARSFEESEAFVKDVCDGYFPQEFKAQYPDGIKLDVRDCRTERAPFQGPGQMSGRKARTLSDIGSTDMRVDDFLNKLPQKTIVDGRPVDIRDAIRERLVPSVEAPVPSDAFATIQVRAFTGARFVLKFGPNATVADLRSKIDAEVASAEPYELRTAFPPRSYRDNEATLEAEGLVPTAVVVLQKVSAST